MPDQFRQLKHGDHLPGLPTRPWNKFLELVQPDFAGEGLGGQATTGVEVKVANNTAAALDAYSIVGLDRFQDYGTDPDSWKDWDIFAGVAPSASAVIAIVRDGIGVGEVGRARLAGRAACRVDVTDITHRYAVPSTSTDHLTSSAAGPVRIVAVENNFTAPAVQWAVVILVGVAPGAGGATRFARFRLAATLAATDASQANCPVDESWGGASPGATVTVYNLPASSNYIFAGPAASKGLATFDADVGKWWIVQMECVAGSGGGGGTGFTGTIGN